jgi:hypothetical protein
MKRRPSYAIHDCQVWRDTTVMRGEAEPGVVRPFCCKIFSTLDLTRGESAMREPKKRRTRRTEMTDEQGVAEMLDILVTDVRRELDAGQLPAPLTIAGEPRWRVKEIRQWVREGCPPRSDWERRHYRGQSSGGLSQGHFQY